MPSSQLKRAEKTIEELRERPELPPGITDAMQELVDVVRTLESRMALLESNQSA